MRVPLPIKADAIPSAPTCRLVRLLLRTTLSGLSAALVTIATASSLSARGATPTQAPPPVKVPSAQDLYRQSLVADERYAYTGKQFLTVWRDDDLTVATATMVSHLPPSLDAIVYTAPRARRGRVIVQNRNQQWTYIPQRSLVVHSFEPADPTPPEQNQQFNLLVSNYSLTVLPKPTVIAGRKAFGVFIMPHATGRPYDHLWIDPYTGVVLRREKYHADGSMASVSYFSDIKFKPSPPLSAADFTPKRWAALKPRQVEQPTLSEISLNPGKLPPPFAGKATVPLSLGGYALQKATVLGTGRKASLHLVYSDGLNTLSMFESLRHSTAPTHVPSSRAVAVGKGRTATVSQRYSYAILNWDASTVNYTLVADMSVRTLIALSQTADPALATAAR